MQIFNSILVGVFFFTGSSLGVKCSNGMYEFSALAGKSYNFSDSFYNYDLTLCGTASKECPNDPEGTTTGMMIQSSQSRCYVLGIFDDAQWTSGEFGGALLHLNNGAGTDCPMGAPRSLTVNFTCSTTTEPSSFKVVDQSMCAYTLLFPTCYACDGGCSNSTPGDATTNASTSPGTAATTTVIPKAATTTSVPKSNCSSGMYEFSALAGKSYNFSDSFYNYDLTLCGTASKECPNDPEGTTTGMMIQSSQSRCYVLGMFDDSAKWTSGAFGGALLHLNNGAGTDCPLGAPRSLTVNFTCSTTTEPSSFKVVDQSMCAYTLLFPTCYACDGGCSNSTPGDATTNASTSPGTAATTTVIPKAATTTSVPKSNCSSGMYEFSALAGKSYNFSDSFYNYDLTLCGTASKECPNDPEGTTTGMMIQSSQSRCYVLGIFDDAQWTSGEFGGALLHLNNGAGTDCPMGAPRSLTVNFTCSTTTEPSSFKVVDQSMCAYTLLFPTCYACDGGCSNSTPGDATTNASTSPGTAATTTVIPKAATTTPAARPEGTTTSTARADTTITQALLWSGLTLFQVQSKQEEFRNAIASVLGLRFGRVTILSISTVQVRRRLLSTQTRLYYSVKVSSGAEDDTTIGRMRSAAYTSALKEKASSITGVPQNSIAISATSPISTSSSEIPKEDDTNQKDDTPMEPTWVWILIAVVAIGVAVYVNMNYCGKSEKLLSTTGDQRWDMNPVRKSSELVPLKRGGYEPPRNSWAV